MGGALTFQYGSKTHEAASRSSTKLTCKAEIRSKS